MAARTAVFTEYADNGNSRTFTTSGHTASKPKLVIQKRREPVNGGQSVASFDVIHATTDPAGDIMTRKVAFHGEFRIPVDANATDVTNVKTLMKDVIASDEWNNSIDSLEWM